MQQPSRSSSSTGRSGYREIRWKSSLSPSILLSVHKLYDRGGRASSFDSWPLIIISIPPPPRPPRGFFSRYVPPPPPPPRGYVPPPPPPSLNVAAAAAASHKWNELLSHGGVLRGPEFRVLRPQAGKDIDPKKH